MTYIEQAMKQNKVSRNYSTYTKAEQSSTRGHDYTMGK